MTMGIHLSNRNQGVFSTAITTAKIPNLFFSHQKFDNHPCWEFPYEKNQLPVTFLTKKKGKEFLWGMKKVSANPSLHRFCGFMCIEVLRHEMVIVIFLYFGYNVLQSTWSVTNFRV